MRENTQKTCTRERLNDPDNNDGVITHLEPDNLQCEVKWAFESITTNKARGGDGITAELFQILKDDAVEVLHSNQYKAQILSCKSSHKSGKLSSGHRTGKGQFSFRSQRKAMPKSFQNYCTIALISHASKAMLKILQVRL